MAWFKTIAQELVGLLVDNARFATIIVAWLAVVWVLSIHVLEDISWSGLVLFGGLALILMESTTRQARRGPR